MARPKRGTERDPTANLGFTADIGKEHVDTFRRDLHPDLRADWRMSKCECGTE